MKITINFGVVSLQLPAKYPQLPAHLVGEIETLIRCILRLSTTMTV